MNIFICIDDTDNLESIGTGEVLEELMAELEAQQLAQCSFVTRHQLFIHPDIAYTSHNSSMCCAGTTQRLEEVVAFCRNYMDSHCAEGSDPGLCILVPDRLASPEPLLAFGRAAKQTVLTKADARTLAGSLGDAVFLSEHGGTGDGIIGALAGCGLRMSGNDGRIKGKLKPAAPGEVWTVADFCRTYHIDRVLDLDRQPVPPDDRLIFKEQSKALYQDFQKTVYAARTPEDDGAWHPLSKKELPKSWMN